jgi:DNA-binding NtrC family response regulator
LEAIGSTILVVDDDAAIRAVLQQALHRVGCTVFSVASGEEALQIIEKNEICVMFIDLGLETMTGFDLCEQIRSKRPDAILYAITGYSGLLGRDEILLAGFDDFIAKPFSVDEIYQAVDRAVDKIQERARKPSTEVCAIKCILLIDDDNQFRKMVCKMLEFEGFQVYEAADGVEGIQCQVENPADLVITDIIMPKKNGIETMLEIMDKMPKVKFITVSGGGWYGAAVELDMAQRLGATVLEKPFGRRALLEAIEKLRNHVQPNFG